METTLSKNERNVGAAMHLTTFLKYFFPFGNFIGPLVLWTLHRERAFTDNHGKEALNFQLSILVYALGIGLICLPFAIIFAVDFISLMESLEYQVTVGISDIRNLSGYILLAGCVGLLLFGLFIFELFAIINATLHASQGKQYHYPLSIPFLKTTSEANSEQNQSKNEHHH
ncbi:DUF4870 domain-containing protein [Flavobacteriaceae bacterium TK19130]|nr:DUF4870 domain-containing protein [Thermobacterium salinum]